MQKKFLLNCLTYVNLEYPSLMKSLTSFSYIAQCLSKVLMWRHRAVQNNNFLCRLLSYVN